MLLLLEDACRAGGVDVADLAAAQRAALSHRVRTLDADVSPAGAGDETPDASPAPAPASVHAHRTARHDQSASESRSRTASTSERGARRMASPSRTDA